MIKRVQIVIPAYQPNLSFFDLIASLVQISDGAPTIHADIVVVDDGSYTPEAVEVFAKISESFNKVVILKHKVNLGKGSALKTAFKYIKDNFDDDMWVVTADADGQHLPIDIWRVVEAGTVSKGPVIGARAFNTNVPLRSRLGNTITRFLFNFFYKNQVTDTQSGLRGFNAYEIPSLLELKSNRYAFEIDALIYFVNNSRLREIPIKTVYEPGNPTSHFRPLLDSMAIYSVLFRQILVSLLALVLEAFLFLTFTYLGLITFLALFTARLITGIILFILNRNFVYNSDVRSIVQAIKYTILAVFNLIISVVIINFGENSLGISKFFGLLISYTVLFMVNFLIQKYVIFNRL